MSNLAINNMELPENQTNMDAQVNVFKPKLKEYGVIMLMHSVFNLT